MVRWPESFDQLVRELRAGRGRPAILDGSSSYAPAAVDRLAGRSRRVSVGEMFINADTKPAVDDLFRTLGDDPGLLVDIEALFTPGMEVEVIGLLRREAQRRPLIVLWPGKVTATRLSYSLPGWADHFDEPARDLVILRPVPTEFPDETPYELERIPA